MSTANIKENVERIELKLEQEDLKLTLDELIKKKKIQKKWCAFLNI